MARSMALNRGLKRLCLTVGIKRLTPVQYLLNPPLRTPNARMRCMNGEPRSTRGCFTSAIAKPLNSKRSPAAMNRTPVSMVTRSGTPARTRVTRR